MAVRGKPIPVRGWWLRLARNLVRQDQRDLATLGVDLAKAQGRPEAWTHGVLSKFAAGKEGVTLELAQALCCIYTRLPTPVVFPRSYEEAIEMMTVTERYDSFVTDDDDGDGPMHVPVVDMNARRPRRSAVAPAAKRGVARRKHA